MILSELIQSFLYILQNYEFNLGCQISCGINVQTLYLMLAPLQVCQSCLFEPNIVELGEKEQNGLLGQGYIGCIILMKKICCGIVQLCHLLAMKLINASHG